LSEQSCKDIPVISGGGNPTVTEANKGSREKKRRKEKEDGRKEEEMRWEIEIVEEDEDEDDEEERGTTRREALEALLGGLEAQEDGREVKGSQTALQGGLELAKGNSSSSSSSSKTTEKKTTMTMVQRAGLLDRLKEAMWKPEIVKMMEWRGTTHEDDDSSNWQEAQEFYHSWMAGATTAGNTPPPPPSSHLIPREPQIVRIAEVDTTGFNHNIRMKMNGSAIKDYAEAMIREESKLNEKRKLSESRYRKAGSGGGSREGMMTGTGITSDPFPPRVIGRKPDGTMVLIDGYHRLEAAKKAFGGTPLPEEYRVKAYVVEVENDNEVKFLSGFLNRQHGVGLKPGEKQRMVTAYLRAGQHWRYHNGEVSKSRSLKSQAVIAQELGVSKRTVQVVINQIPNIKRMYKKRTKQGASRANNPEGANGRMFQQKIQESGTVFEKDVVVMGSDKGIEQIFQAIKCLPKNGMGEARLEAQLELLLKYVRSDCKTEAKYKATEQGMKTIQKKFPVSKMISAATIQQQQGNRKQSENKALVTCLSRIKGIEEAEAAERKKREKEEAESEF
jgi:hypothetical protein